MGLRPLITRRRYRRAARSACARERAGSGAARVATTTDHRSHIILASLAEYLRCVTQMSMQPWVRVGTDFKFSTTMIHGQRGVLN